MMEYHGRVVLADSSDFAETMDSLASQIATLACRAEHSEGLTDTLEIVAPETIGESTSETLWRLFDEVCELI